QWADPPTAAHPSASADASSRPPGSRHQDNQQDNSQQNPNPCTARPFLPCRPQLRCPGQCYTLVIRNILRQLPRGCDSAATVVSLSEVRLHQPPCVSRTRIRYYGLKPVTHFRPILPVVRRYQQHHSVICLFLPDPQLFEELVCIRLHIVSVQRYHRDDGHLRPGPLLQLRRKRLPLRMRRRSISPREGRNGCTLLIPLD